MLGDVPEGHVAVYACDQDISAHLGELSVTSLKARGVAGCVLDGGCRDVGFILDEGFPVFTRFVTPEDSTWRWELEATQVPVTIGRVRVEPGDWVVGDDDGVVVVPRAIAEDVLAEAEQKAATESEIRARRSRRDAAARGVRALRNVLSATRRSAGGCGFQAGDESLVSLSVSFSTSPPPSSTVKIASVLLVGDLRAVGRP